MSAVDDSKVVSRTVPVFWVPAWMSYRTYRSVLMPHRTYRVSGTGFDVPNSMNCPVQVFVSLRTLRSPLPTLPAVYTGGIDRIPVCFPVPRQPFELRLSCFALPNEHNGNDVRQTVTASGSLLSCDSVALPFPTSTMVMMSGKPSLPAATFVQ